MEGADDVKMETEGAKKRYKPYFTDEEKNAIVDAVEPNFAYLNAKHSTTVTAKGKTKKWEEIAAKCNNVNPTANRTGLEVKKKWDNMVTNAKKRLHEVKYPPTGGGQKVEDLTPLQERILAIFGDAAAIHGLQKGVESGVPADGNQTESEDGLLDFNEAAKMELAADKVVPMATPKSSKEFQPKRSLPPPKSQPQSKKSCNKGEFDDNVDLQREVLLAEKLKIAWETHYFKLKCDKLQREMPWYNFAPVFPFNPSTSVSQDPNFPN